MIRYFDSGAGGPDDCLGKWLDNQLVDGIRTFRGQFGFFDISALRKYLPTIQRMVDAGGVFRLVIGANNGDPASTDDINAILPVVAGGGDAKLAVVGLSNALFHPKTLHMIRADESIVAVVGSANMTSKGLGHNVEAGVIIESGDRTYDALDKVKSSIDYWFSCTDSGVYMVNSEAEAEILVELGLIVSPSTRRRLRRASRTHGSTTGRGTRRPGWRPPTATGDREEPAEVEGGGEVDVSTEEEVVERSAIAARWCKRLPTSDAQQPSATQRTVHRPQNKPTNVTGSIRLTNSGFDIEANQYFRDEFFGELDWALDVRRGNTYEQVHVSINVTLPGKASRPYRLLVDHAAHRADHAGEPTTVLKWGPEIGQWLRNNNQTGNWVVIEKDLDGQYWLSFQVAKPEWAP